ncbi:MAG: hypothetical protein HQ515_09690 [Phycisphaeraceae bacterium]|nr:hypothetical protein [Phycisphaeraceae bacterium]
MTQPRVLILGDHNCHELADMISSLGFSPAVWGSSMHCLAKLRDNDSAAVVVDLDFVHADVLKFLFDVQEINDSITIVVVGCAVDDQVDQAIVSQTRAVFVDSGKGRLCLRETLATRAEVS